MAKNKEETPDRLTLYTLKLDDDQFVKLKTYCDRRMWEFYMVDYARFAFRSKIDKINLVAYTSGKLVIQGKGTEDFVRDVVEPQITGEPKLGYDEVHHPEWYEPHAGLDEAGKGDLFGPLVTACVIADGDMVREWQKKGLRDSKQMTDSSAYTLEKLIRKTKGVVVEVAFCGMPKYNELMGKPGANLNRLLAWLHARSLENALKKRRVDWGLLDQFSKQPLVGRYYKDPKFDLKMRPRAESDPVVAAASVCARTGFLRQLENLSKRFGESLCKGSGAPAKNQGFELVKKLGQEALGDFAKMHFKTSREILEGR